MIRKPVVAGTFYPADRTELKGMVNRFLKDNKIVKLNGKLNALIVPHAGYVYSGIVAGAGFRLLKDKSYKKVILLGPSHQVYFPGAAIATEDFQTPLGIVKVGKVKKFFKENLVGILPQAHAQEHCLEVELPFLQETLKEFELFALILGDVDEKKLAEHLLQFIDSDTLVVVSSDLSHYHDCQSAKKIDQKIIDNILNFNFTKLEACGEKPIMVLMHLAKRFYWKPQLLYYKNSGDTAGDKSKVVGYAAIAYTAEK